MPDFSTPIPDRDSTRYWKSLAEGRLELQRCDDCGAWSWPPRPLCSRCHGEHLSWARPSGTGQVHSWVVAHRPFVPALADEVPYTIALVRLDDDPEVMVLGRLVDGEPVRQGLPVRFLAHAITDDVGEILWQAVAS